MWLTWAGWMGLEYWEGVWFWNTLRPPIHWGSGVFPRAKWLGPKVSFEWAAFLFHIHDVLGSSISQSVKGVDILMCS